MSFFGGGFFGGGFFGGAGGKGKPGKKKNEYWSLTIDGKAMVFTSLDSLISFLDQREAQHVDELEVTAEADAQRIILVGSEKADAKPPRVRIESNVAEIQDYAADVQAKIDRLYWKALAQSLARQAEEEEDIKYIARLL